MSEQQTTALHVLVKGQPGMLIGLSQFPNYVLVKFPDARTPAHVHFSEVDPPGRGASEH